MSRSQAAGRLSEADVRSSGCEAAELFQVAASLEATKEAPLGAPLLLLFFYGARMSACFDPHQQGRGFAITVFRHEHQAAVGQ